MNKLERLLDIEIDSNNMAGEYLNELSDIIDNVFSKPPFVSDKNPDVIAFYPETLHKKWKDKYKYPPHDETYESFIEGIEAKKAEVLSHDELLKKIEDSKIERLTSIDQYNEYLSLLIQLIKKAEKLLSNDKSIPFKGDKTVFSFCERPLKEYIVFRNMTARKIEAYKSDEPSKEITRAKQENIYKIKAITAEEIFLFLKSLGYAEEKILSGKSYYHIKSDKPTRAEYLLSFTIEEFFIFNQQNPDLQLKSDTKKSIANEFYYIRSDSPFVPESIGPKSLKHHKDKVQRLNSNVKNRIKDAIKNTI